MSKTSNFFTALDGILGIIDTMQVAKIAKTKQDTAFQKMEYANFLKNQSMEKTRELALNEKMTLNNLSEASNNLDQSVNFLDMHNITEGMYKDKILKDVYGDYGNDPNVTEDAQTILKNKGLWLDDNMKVQFENVKDYNLQLEYMDNAIVEQNKLNAALDLVEGEVEGLGEIAGLVKDTALSAIPGMLETTDFQAFMDPPPGYEHGDAGKEYFKDKPDYLKEAFLTEETTGRAPTFGFVPESTSAQRKQALDLATGTSYKNDLQMRFNEIKMYETNKDIDDNLKASPLITGGVGEYEASNISGNLNLKNNISKKISEYMTKIDDNQMPNELQGLISLAGDQYNNLTENPDNQNNLNFEHTISKIVNSVMPGEGEKGLGSKSWAPGFKVGSGMEGADFLPGGLTPGWLDKTSTKNKSEHLKSLMKLWLRIDRQYPGYKSMYSGTGMGDDPFPDE